MTDEPSGSVSAAQLRHERGPEEKDLRGREKEAADEAMLEKANETGENEDLPAGEDEPVSAEERPGVPGMTPSEEGRTP